MNDLVVVKHMLHGVGVYPIGCHNEIGLQDLAICGRDLAVLAIIVYHFGQRPDFAGTSGPFLLGGEPSQLAVEVDTVDGVHGQAPRRFAVLVVGADLGLHVGAVYQAHPA